MKIAPFIAAAVTAALLGTAGVSIAGATSSSGNSTAKAPGKALQIAAATIGVSPADLVQQLRAGKSVADVATAHHVDPQTVINALAGADKTRIAERVNRKGLPNARRALRRGVQLAAKAMGVTPRELRAQLRAGKSIADVASEHGVNLQTVTNALVAAATKQIDAAKSAGRIPASQATKIEANLPNRIDTLVHRHFGAKSGG
jgi:uncharacterized protein (DUF433 family)